MSIDDMTEPEHLELVEGVENPEEEPFLWRVELYLISKYMPEFAEATIFKVRQVAQEHAKIAREHYDVHRDISSLERAISADLDRYVKWIPPSSHHLKQGGSPRSPGVGRRYERLSEEL